VGARMVTGGGRGRPRRSPPRRLSPSPPISAMMLRACAAAVYWLRGSAGCRSDSPNPRRSGAMASTAAVTRGTTAR
jgi:hypothetical protein